ncbi:MAG: T9SS type A sorting domain-containing protein [Saprospiraceae bacterium]
MKHSLLPFLFLVSLNILKAQSYHPMPISGAQWNVARCWFFYPGGWHDEYAIKLDGGDTTINGHVYKKLFLETHHAPGTEFDSTYTHFLGAMREANKQVFFICEYQCNDTIERMVYDFNEVVERDTIYAQVLTNGLTQFVPHIVTSLDSVLIGGEYHRRINLRDENDFFAESWTEGLGSSLGLTYASYWLLTDNSYDLTCFYNQNVLNYSNPQPSYGFCNAPLPDIQCSSTTSIPPLQTEQIFTVNPNPAFDELIVSSTIDFHSVHIFNSLGEKMNSCGYTRSLDVHNLTPGLYFIQFMDDHQQLQGVSRFVKQ